MARASSSVSSAILRSFSYRWCLWWREKRGARVSRLPFVSVGSLNVFLLVSSFFHCRWFKGCYSPQNWCFSEPACPSLAPIQAPSLERVLWAAWVLRCGSCAGCPLSETSATCASCESSRLCYFLWSRKPLLPDFLHPQTCSCVGIWIIFLLAGHLNLCCYLHIGENVGHMCLLFKFLSFFSAFFFGEGMGEDSISGSHHCFLYLVFLWSPLKWLIDFYLKIDLSWIFMSAVTHSPDNYHVLLQLL